MTHTKSLVDCSILSFFFFKFETFTITKIVNFEDSFENQINFELRIRIILPKKLKEFRVLRIVVDFLLSYLNLKNIFINARKKIYENFV